LAVMTSILVYTTKRKSQLKKLENRPIINSKEATSTKTSVKETLAFRNATTTHKAVFISVCDLEESSEEIKSYFIYSLFKQ